MLSRVLFNPKILNCCWKTDLNSSRNRKPQSALLTIFLGLSKYISDVHLVYPPPKQNKTNPNQTQNKPTTALLAQKKCAAIREKHNIYMYAVHQQTHEYY